MNRNDPKLDHWAEVLTLARSYAAKNARRHFLLCDAHVVRRKPTQRGDSPWLRTGKGHPRHLGRRPPRGRAKSVKISRQALTNQSRKGQ